MSEITKPIPKLPPRLSAPKIEDTKPSKIVEIFWWMVFIIPVAFTYWATNSILAVVVLISIRVAIMFVPKLRKKTVVINPEKPVKSEAKVITHQNPLTPYKEEARAEWYGLLKFLRIYDKEKEEKNLSDYRKLREWD